MASFNYISDYELRRGSGYAAGFDLKCTQVSLSKSRHLVRLHLGVKVMFETEEDRRNHMFMLCPRSSFSQKFELQMINAPGIIDADYQGELIMMVGPVVRQVPVIENLIAKAEQCLDSYVAQLIPVQSGSVLMFPKKVSRFNITTDRGEGGFGSTDE